MADSTTGSGTAHILAHISCMPALAGHLQVCMSSEAFIALPVLQQGRHVCRFVQHSSLQQADDLHKLSVIIDLQTLLH